MLGFTKNMPKINSVYYARLLLLVMLSKNKCLLLAIFPDQDAILLPPSSLSLPKLSLLSTIHCSSKSVLYRNLTCWSRR